MEIVLGHTLCVRSNGGAFYGNTVLLGSIGRVDCHLVACFITMNEAEVIISNLRTGG